MSNPLDVLANLAYHLVAGLAGITQPLFGTAAAATGIVLGTAALRLLLVPAAYAQHRADLRRSQLMARVAELNEKYQRNKRRLQEELEKLYRAESVGLLRGFLPMLVQIPIFAGLYRLFVSPTIGGHANALLHQTLFGVPLGAHLFSVSGPQLLVFAGLVALLAALGYASSRLLRPTGARPSGALGMVMRVVPYAPMLTMLFVPLAATLYVATSTAWTIAQTLVLRSL